MSHKVVSLVYSRRVGSAYRKAILAYMADRASDDGRGVFCSKGTIAEETEIARSTVFKTIRDLVEEGVLIEAGARGRISGYALSLAALHQFPEALGPERGDLESRRGRRKRQSRKPIPKRVKDAVLARDGGCCVYCGATDGHFHLGHVFPWSRGGMHTAENLVVACQPCNLSKSDMTPEEWGGRNG